MIAALSPLVRATTYRRAVFLLLDGVLVLPYVLLGVVIYRIGLAGQYAAVAPPTFRFLLRLLGDHASDSWRTAFPTW